MEAYQCWVLLRRLRPLLLAAWLLTAGGLCSYAQSPAMHRDTDAPSFPMADAPELSAKDPAGGVICGTVLDGNGAEVEGATVILEGASGKELFVTTGDNGFFRFNSLEAGSFKVKVTAKGFSKWSSTGLTLHPNENYDLPPVELEIAMSTTEVEVVFTQYDMAEDQIHAQEKQRVLGVIPNFWVSYVGDAPPLTAGQKFQLALRSTVDPVSFLSAGFVAGVEQWQNEYRGYGPGASGYFSRIGASYGDGLTSSFLGGAVLPSILHQDPRYFYKGRGSIRSRALYAMSAVVICKGDNRRWEPNYSNVLGNLASAGISSSYYPPANRGARLVVDNWLVGTASGAIGNLFQEFLVRKISRGVPKETEP